MWGKVRERASGEGALQVTPDLDTLIRMKVGPGEDDLGRGGETMLRSTNVRITYGEEYVTIMGVGLAPYRLRRSRVGRMEAGIK